MKSSSQRLRPKKSLGQHFLHEARILQRIVDACGIEPSDTVVEIGPGTGALTRLLAERSGRVYALELDERLVNVLRREFQSVPNVSILHQNALAFDPAAFRRTSRLKVIGNIPYYISTPLLERLFRYRRHIGQIGITVQKEFARRVVAAPGSKEYGSLSCFAQYHCTASLLFCIGRGCFTPAPKVDSAFLRLCPRTEVAFEADPAGEEAFFRIVRGAFSQRRKMLSNALSGVADGATLEHFFLERGMSPRVRGEVLSLPDFVRLAEIVRGKDSR